jgi:hypothetical protein
MVAFTVLLFLIFFVVKYEYVRILGLLRPLPPGALLPTCRYFSMVQDLEFLGVDDEIGGWASRELLGVTLIFYPCVLGLCFVDVG